MDLSGDQVGPHALARHPHPDQVLGLVAEHTAISRGMGERRNENNERDESGGGRWRWRGESRSSVCTSAARANAVFSLLILMRCLRTLLWVIVSVG